MKKILTMILALAMMLSLAACGEKKVTLEILDTEYAVEEYAAIVSKDNTELFTKVNTALQELIDDGTVAQIVAKYIPAE